MTSYFSIRTAKHYKKNQTVMLYFLQEMDEGGGGIYVLKIYRKNGISCGKGGIMVKRVCMKCAYLSEAYLIVLMCVMSQIRKSSRLCLRTNKISIPCSITNTHHTSYTSTCIIHRHNDIAWQYQQRVNNHVYDINLSLDVTEQWGWSHTDIPRLRKGRVGAQVTSH